MRLLPRIVAPAVMVALAAGSLLSGIPGCARRPTVTAAVPIARDLPDLHQAGLSQQWQRQVRMEPGERITKVWRVGVSVYVATSEFRLVRIDAKTGELKWSQGLGHENFDVYRPIELKTADETPSKEVLVVTRGEVFTFSMETGDETRTPARLGVSVSCEPAVIGNTLCVGGADTFYGLYLDRPDLRHWVVKARGDMFVSSPVTAENNLLVASRKGQLWRISAETGDWDWRDRKTNGDVVAGLVADFNALYVPCLNQRVYAFRADSGGELWETQLAGRLEDTPVAGGPVIMVKSQSNGLYALARVNGEIKWHAPDVMQVVTALDDSAWVADNAGNIKSLSLETGEVLASAPAPGIQMFVPNTVDKKVILVGEGGVVGIYTPPAKKETNKEKGM